MVRTVLSEPIPSACGRKIPTLENPASLPRITCGLGFVGAKKRDKSLVNHQESLMFREPVSVLAYRTVEGSEEY